jgi:L-threonylcarbamoyladenylate synthase
MSNVTRAVEILNAGGLVAFPTETVYGLGADATNSHAVRRIFEAKGRPATNPVIVHVPDEGVARRYAGAWPEGAAKLAARFWPGPLTIVVPKSESIVAEVAAGGDTVGLRAPDHPLALELLRAFDGPLAAPSANRSTHVSPTTAKHVRDELGNRVDLILDGGPCHVGIESTVLDLTAATPTILRPGAVTRDQLEDVIGAVRLRGGVADPSTTAKSPGQQAKHYAPRAAAYRFERQDRLSVIDWCRDNMDVAWAVLFLGPLGGGAAFSDLETVVVAETPPSRHRLIQMPAGAQDYARRLYSTLRELDEQGVEVLWVEMPPDLPQWAALRDRLMRATRPA